LYDFVLLYLSLQIKKIALINKKWLDSSSS